jgi:hypothetical protein
MTRLFLLIAVLWSCLACPALAQDAVPQEILLRTLFVKVGDHTGTAFKIDYMGKIYLVTARHVAAGLPERDAVIQVRRGQNWEDLHTIRTLLPPSNAADIAVLETDEIAAQPFQITVMDDTDGFTMGQQIWFLGFPFGGLGTLGLNGELIPFMKRGTMSAVDPTNHDAVVLYIDGFNNPGFSGGPILFWSFSKHKYEIAGVVQGYQEDTAKVLVNGTHVDTNILVNSGILIAYSIKHAVQAINNIQ